MKRSKVIPIFFFLALQLEKSQGILLTLNFKLRIAVQCNAALNCLCFYLLFNSSRNMINSDYNFIENSHANSDKLHLV